MKVCLSFRMETLEIGQYGNEAFFDDVVRERSSCRKLLLCDFTAVQDAHQCYMRRADVDFYSNHSLKLHRIAGAARQAL